MVIFLDLRTTDENRTLVVLGLKKINSLSVNIGLKMLCEYLGLTNKITSSDIAFRISPRINAAGRMGDAYRAFELLTEKDKSKILELIKDISLDNQKRRDICEELHNQALELLSSEDLINEYAIILHSMGKGANKHSSRPNKRRISQTDFFIG